MVVDTFFAQFQIFDLIVHNIGEKIVETNKLIERKKIQSNKMMMKRKFDKAFFCFITLTFRRLKNCFLSQCNLS